MALPTVPVQQAAADELAAYLATKLTGIAIEPRWPDPDKRMDLPALTIIGIGARSDIPVGPHVYSTTAGTGVNLNARVQLAVCEQMFQFDIWANDPLERNTILAQLDDIMNNDPLTGEAVHGLLLRGTSADWPDTYFDFYMESPDVREAPFTQIVGEYRATVLVHAWFGLAVSRQYVKQAVINFKQRLTETDPVSTYDTYRV